MSIIDDYQAACVLTAPDHIVIQNSSGVLKVESNYDSNSEHYSLAVKLYKRDPKKDVLFVALSKEEGNVCMGMTVSEAEELVERLQHTIGYIKQEAAK